MQNTSKQRGIAIGPILFVVAILAVLAAAIAAGSGSFSSSTATENARAQAAALIQMGDNIAKSTARVAARCSERQISFENGAISGYTNANAPSDGSCHVFLPQGGGATFPQLPQDWFVSANSAHPNWGEVFFPRGMGVSFMGLASTPELLLLVSWIRLDTCLEINNRLGIPNQTVTQPYAANSAPGAPITMSNKFAGTYFYDAIIDDTRFRGRIAGCFRSSSDNVTGNNYSPEGYFFYQVLMMR